MQRTHLNIVATLETSIGRMPANIEAERSILGAVLLDQDADGPKYVSASSMASPIE